MRIASIPAPGLKSKDFLSDQFSDVNHEALQWVQDKSPEIKHKRESPFITPPQKKASSPLWETLKISRCYKRRDRSIDRSFLKNKCQSEYFGVKEQK